MCIINIMGNQRKSALLICYNIIILFREKWKCDCVFYHNGALIIG